MCSYLSSSPYILQNHVLTIREKPVYCMLLCYSFSTKDSKSESHVHLKSELMFLFIMQSIEREGDLHSFQGLNLLILSEKNQKQ